MLIPPGVGTKSLVKPSRVLSVALGWSLAALVALTNSTPANAASISDSAKKSFISSLASAAQSSQRTYGVPASVSIAQAIVNSDWGSSTLAKSANNFWNTRCTRSLKPSQFAALADAQVGKAYVLGAEALASNPNPTKFDCSELVEWLFARSGNKITDLAASQYNATKPVTGSPKVGDMVFLRNKIAMHELSVVEEIFLVAHFIGFHFLPAFEQAEVHILLALRVKIDRSQHAFFSAFRTVYGPVGETGL